MISFRLTDDEYERFRCVCATLGLRNVSELVRNAVNRLIGEAGVELESSSSDIVVRVATLESKLAHLTTAVAQMENRFVSQPLNGNHAHMAQSSGQ